MAKDKSHTIDWKGLNLVVDEINGVVPSDGSAAAAGDVTVTPPASDATWTDVQAALDDIAARLAVLEP